MGCTGGGNGNLSEQTASAKFSKGIFNSTIKINGAEKTAITLGSKQPAEIGLVVKNEGPNDVSNMTFRAIGCVDYDNPINGIVNRTLLAKGVTDYISWSVRAPELGTSESFSCPLIIRTCFNEISKGYFEIDVLPENYTNVPGTANSYYQSGLFKTASDFGVLRIINGSSNIYYGTLRLNNSGSGWIDYINQSPESNLGADKIRSIKMDITGNTGIDFYKIGDYQVSEASAGTKYLTTGDPEIRALNEKYDGLVNLPEGTYYCKWGGAMDGDNYRTLCWKNWK
jgi:hypothetical protein